MYEHCEGDLTDNKVSVVLRKNRRSHGAVASIYNDSWRGKELGVRGFLGKAHREKGRERKN